jgi:predicted RNase H-like HicB family nuclease
MFKMKTYPAILEKTQEGYSVFFPDLPGAISAGDDYEQAVIHAKECLSLHLYGMLQDHDPIPEPSHVSEMINQMDEAHLIALIEPDVFAVKVAQENKTVQVNVTLPQSLLDAMDMRASELGMDRSVFIEKAAREAI